jgi:hypothetical protein
MLTADGHTMRTDSRRCKELRANSQAKETWFILQFSLALGKLRRLSNKVLLCYATFMPIGRDYCVHPAAAIRVLATHDDDRTVG